MQLYKPSLLPLLFTSLCLFSCRLQPETPTSDSSEVENGTPVTLTSTTIGPINETVELNATAVYQLKSFIKATATGYLQTVDAALGRHVNKGQDVFTIKTKEAQAVGNTLSELDSSLHFSGIVHISSPINGFVTILHYSVGDYVQDGEPLAEISDKNSFGFVLDLPYELKPFLNQNKHMKVHLADGTVLNGTIDASMPSADFATQTQQVLIKVNTAEQIPENLIGKISLVKKSKTNALMLPKEAILTDEVQSSFWVMKLIDSTTAVKVEIKKGLENEGMVEILSPPFRLNDRILLTGNYGLADTAKVVVK